MFALKYAKVKLKRLIMKNSEKINFICVNASFRTAELLWLCKSIEMLTIFMEHKSLTDTNFKKQNIQGIYSKSPSITF